MRCRTDAKTASWRSAPDDPERAGDCRFLSDARGIAETRGHAVVGTEHILLAMTRQPVDAFARRMLDEVGATQSLRSRIEAIIGEG